MVTTSCNEGDNDKDVGDSDEELITVVERDFKRQAWQPADHFEKLLEATCPNHTYHIKDKLMECTMMKNNMTMGTFARGKKPKGDLMGKALSLKRRWSCQLMVGHPPPPHESQSKLKLTGRAINAVRAAVLEYMH
jgi:hypothetical protein